MVTSNKYPSNATMLQPKPVRSYVTNKNAIPTNRVNTTRKKHQCLRHKHTLTFSLQEDRRRAQHWQQTRNVWVTIDNTIFFSQQTRVRYLKLAGIDAGVQYVDASILDCRCRSEVVPTRRTEFNNVATPIIFWFLYACHEIPYPDPIFGWLQNVDNSFRDNFAGS